MRGPLLTLALVLILIGFFLYVIDYWSGVQPGSQVTGESTQDMLAEETESPPAPDIKYPVTNEFLELPGSMEEAPAVETTGPSGEGTEPAIKPEPLPGLDESDTALELALVSFLTRERYDRLFLSESFVRRFVVTIDNMTEKKLPRKFRFTQNPAGKFIVRKESEEVAYIDSANYNRYTPFVILSEIIDVRDFVSVYVRYYPLFQQAYEDLGYPDRYFNDRLIEVIDHLLAAPEIKEPIKLVRPKVFYNFADPQLESLSAGQKIMVRIGYDNARKVKTGLRELRQLLVSLGG